MINFDLNKLDQDKIRKQKRKKLLLISIAPCIILLVLGAFFLRPAITMMLYNMNYSGKNYKGAESVADTQNFLNIIEPYIADYQIGTAMIQDGDYTGAEQKLISSLEQDPDEENVCKVRTNLAYSIEKQADKLSSEENYSDAIIKYSEAVGYLSGDNCADQQDSSKGSDEQAQKAMDRDKKKIKDLVEKLNSQADDNKPSDEDKYHDGQYNDAEVTDDELQQMQNNSLQVINSELYGKIMKDGSSYSYQRCDDYSGDHCY